MCIPERLQSRLYMIFSVRSSSRWHLTQFNWILNSAVFSDIKQISLYLLKDLLQKYHACFSLSLSPSWLLFSLPFFFKLLIFLPLQVVKWSVIEASSQSVLAAGSVAIRKMDGTYIISYLHLQELKWFLSSNKNKSKERNLNCSHQVVNSIHPQEPLCRQCYTSLSLQAEG